MQIYIEKYAQFLHNTISSCPTISHCLMQNIISSTAPDIPQQKWRLFQILPPLWVRHSTGVSFGCQQQQRNCTHTDWDDCSREPTTASRQGFLLPQPRLTRDWSQSQQAKNQQRLNHKLQGLAKAHRTAFNWKSFRSPQTWKTLIWPRAGESTFLTEIPSSVTDKQLFPSGWRMGYPREHWGQTDVELPSSHQVFEFSSSPSS